MTDDQLVMYTDALVQLMNTFQSKGEPEACISALQNVAVITCLNVEVAHLFH